VDARQEKLNVDFAGRNEWLDPCVTLRRLFAGDVARFKVARELLAWVMSGKGMRSPWAISGKGKVRRETAYAHSAAVMSGVAGGLIRQYLA
jgi:hypothetical protein